MTKYEVITQTGSHFPDLTAVNARAAEGWELVEMQQVQGSTNFGWVFLMKQEQVARAKPAPKQDE
jgi:hypothetical protein